MLKLVMAHTLTRTSGRSRAGQSGGFQKLRPLVSGICKVACATWNTATSDCCQHKVKPFQGPQMLSPRGTKRGQASRRLLPAGTPKTHVLEIIFFPPGKAPKWHPRHNAASPASPGFLDDHTAIVVSDRRKRTSLILSRLTWFCALCVRARTTASSLGAFEPSLRLRGYISPGCARNTGRDIDAP